MSAGHGSPMGPVAEKMIRDTLKDAYAGLATKPTEAEKALTEKPPTPLTWTDERENVISVKLQGSHKPFSRSFNTFHAEKRKKRSQEMHMCISRLRDSELGAVATRESSARVFYMRILAKADGGARRTRGQEG